MRVYLPHGCGLMRAVTPEPPSQTSWARALLSKRLHEREGVSTDVQESRLITARRLTRCPRKFYHNSFQPQMKMQNWSSSPGLLYWLRPTQQRVKGTAKGRLVSRATGVSLVESPTRFFSHHSIYPLWNGCPQCGIFMDRKPLNPAIIRTQNTLEWRNWQTQQTQNGYYTLWHHHAPNRTEAKNSVFMLVP